MRKFMVIPMAGLLALAVAAPVSAGSNVSNSSGSASTGYGSWFSEAGDESTFGYLSAWQEQGQAAVLIDVFIESGRYVDCTPADENDDLFGFQGTYQYGSGSGTLTVGKAFGSATASGLLDIETATVDDCAGTYDETLDSGVAVSLALVANGPKILEKGSGSFKIPSQVNTHYSYSSTSRGAAGTARIAGDDIAVDGGIGKVSWRDHSNG
jgi:hypothetical protein